MKYGPNERTEQNSRKRTEHNGDKQSIRSEFKTLVTRMPKELIGYFNSIKKMQAIMKVTVSEIKKDSQGTNSGMGEAKNQINDLEHKEEKNFRTVRRKKIK